MAESPADPPRGTDGRGRTTIADKVVERLAARAALDVPGVARHSPGPDALSAFTSDLPKASADSAGERLTLSLDIAVEWAASARDVAAAVREQVRERLQAGTGKAVDRVDVTVAALLTPAQLHAPDERRVR